MSYDELGHRTQGPKLLFRVFLPNSSFDASFFMGVSVILIVWNYEDESAMLCYTEGEIMRLQAPLPDES